MTATSHPQFNGRTEALQVAKAFPDAIRGKTIVVTGVNRGGIGFATSEAFASQSPAHLILAGRNQSKIQECIDVLKNHFPSVDYRVLQMDLSSQKSIRTAAAELLSWVDVPTVDIIINNAGVFCLPDRTLSEDGIEMHFATNHIGHFLFTCLIMPKLINASQGNPKGTTRIINVTTGSLAVARMRWSDVNFEKKNIDLPKDEQPPYNIHRMWGTNDPENVSYMPLAGYNQSKIANVLFGIGANKRLYSEYGILSLAVHGWENGLYSKYGILSLAVHPGVIETELTRNATPETVAAIKALQEKGAFTYKTLGEGAATTLVAALDPGLGVGEIRDGKENYGVFLADCQIDVRAHPLAVSASEAEKLWDLSESLVKEKFSW